MDILFLEGNSMETTIKKWGNSQGIRLSKELLELIGAKINDKLNIQLNDKNELVLSKVVLEDTITFDSLFANWDEEYDGGEFIWGDEEAVGKEIW